MRFQISEDAKKRTTECPSNFHCLEENARPMCANDEPVCEGDYLPEGNGLYIKPNGMDECTYRMPYRSTFLCLCPVRIELYKKYNI